MAQGGPRTLAFTPGGDRAAPGQENGTGCPRGPKVSQCALPTTAIRRQNRAVLHPRSALKSSLHSDSPGAWETPCERVLCAAPLFAVRPSGHQHLQWDPRRGRDTARHPATTHHADHSLEPQSCPVRTSRTCHCAKAALWRSSPHSPHCSSVTRPMPTCHSHLYLRPESLVSCGPHAPLLLGVG